jgi:hypothetical protein
LYRGPLDNPASFALPRESSFEKAPLRPPKMCNDVVVVVVVVVVAVVVVVREDDGDDRDCDDIANEWAVGAARRRERRRTRCIAPAATIAARRRVRVDANSAIFADVLPRVVAVHFELRFTNPVCW